MKTEKNIEQDHLDNDKEFIESLLYDVLNDSKIESIMF
jgi:hypothetical protein